MKIFSTSFYKFLSVSIVSISFFMLASAVNAATISRPMQSLGLVGYWSFDVGKGGAKAVDMSGRGNNGTLTNMNTTAAWVGGKIGNALDFDGSNDRISATKLSLGTSNFSFSAWVNLQSQTNLECVFGNDPAAGSFLNNWMVHVANTGVVNLYTVQLSSVTSAAGTSNIYGGWHYITTVRNGTTHQVYVDGQLEGTTVGTVRNVTDSVNPEGFSLCTYVNWSQLKGQVDEARIYNRALSAEEIKRLYRQTSPQMNASQANKLRQGLVGMWTFDGNDMSGNTAIDRSGQGNNGTLSGVKPVIGKIGQGADYVPL